MLKCQKLLMFFYFQNLVVFPHCKLFSFLIMGVTSHIYNVLAALPEPISDLCG